MQPSNVGVTDQLKVLKTWLKQNEAHPALGAHRDITQDLQPVCLLGQES